MSEVRIGQKVTNAEEAKAWNKRIGERLTAEDIAKGPTKPKRKRKAKAKVADLEGEE